MLNLTSKFFLLELFALGEALRQYEAIGNTRYYQHTEFKVDSFRSQILCSFSLGEALRKYEAIRKFPTAKITLNSWFLGFIETQKGVGAAVRDRFFSTMARVGVAQFVFLDGATPKVGDK